MKQLRLLYGLLTPHERGRLIGLLSMMIGASFLEVCGIGLIFPYIAVVQDPARIGASPALQRVYDGLGFDSPRSFCIFLSLALLGIFLLKAAFSIWLTSRQSRFFHDKQVALGRRLIEGYLRGPYAFFLSANTATIIGTLASSVVQLCTGMMQSALLLLTEVVIAIGLVVFLLTLNPLVSAATGVVLGGIAWAFLRAVRTRVAGNAAEYEARYRAMIRVVNESMNSAKELHVLGRQGHFISAYSEESGRFSGAGRRNTLLSQLPRVFLETTAIAGMVLFTVFTLVSGENRERLFPILAVFAVAAVRIVPSISRILQAWNSLHFLAPALAAVRTGLEACPGPFPPISTPPAFAFRREIRMAVDSFRYPTNSAFCLRGIDVTIKRGQRVAFVGYSGSGKTTAIDLLLGLFPGFEGSITVDGVDIRENMEGWRRNVGYIPQNSYLCDATIGHNIALGVAPAEIDMERVKRAAGLAGLAPVLAVQPAGLETVVGERGIRLSGGERQRIGIARALYHDPELLVLDEATSALDNETERQIVASILGLSPAKTIVVIAHRLGTVKDCDCVHLMREGRIIDRGPFGELALRHPDFVNPPNVRVGEPAPAAVSP